MADERIQKPFENLFSESLNGLTEHLVEEYSQEVPPTPLESVEQHMKKKVDEAHRSLFASGARLANGVALLNKALAEETEVK